MSGRFDYIKYDETSQLLAQGFKEGFEALEMAIDAMPDGRSKSLALTSLEETYMWVGKALRDRQIAINGTAELQEERCNS